jgi:hypothetical protein
MPIVTKQIVLVWSWDWAMKCHVHIRGWRSWLYVSLLPTSPFSRQLMNEDAPTACWRHNTLVQQPMLYIWPSNLLSASRLGSKYKGEWLECLTEGELRAIHSGVCTDKRLGWGWPIVLHPSGLVYSPKKPKKIQDSLSHRILRHMHRALNIDENKN